MSLESNWTVLGLLLIIATASSQDCIGFHGDTRVIGVNCTGGVAGRIEISVEGEWRAVCDERWNPSDARVVCHQLGFNPQGAGSCRLSCFGQSNNLPGIQNIACKGSEGHLFDCSYSRVDNCNADAGVICGPVTCLPGSMDNVSTPFTTYPPSPYFNTTSLPTTFPPADTTSDTPPPPTNSTPNSIRPISKTTPPSSTCPTCDCTDTTPRATEHAHSEDTPLSPGASGEGQQSRSDSCTAIGGGLGALAVVLALTLVGVVLGWVWHCRRNKGYKKSRFNSLRMMEPKVTPPPSPVDHSFPEYATVSKPPPSTEQGGVATALNLSYGTSTSISRPHPSAEPGSGRVCPNPSYAVPSLPK